MARSRQQARCRGLLLPLPLLLLLLLLLQLLSPALSAGRGFFDDDDGGGDDDQEAARDRIEYLPGWPHDLPSKHFAGYVRVGGEEEESDGEGSGGGEPPPAARQIWYYLVESENDPRTDPVVVWLNGGPGCSSLDAFVYEHGPFLFSPVAAAGLGRLPTLTLNPFSWSKAATMIYIDSPANVGLSYVEVAAADADAHPHYRTNDTHTARDLAAVLRSLLGERHPRLLGRGLYVTGESYAGVYVPMLAREIVRGNEKAATTGSSVLLNLRGYAVGNGVTDPRFDGDALPPFLAGRGLLPQDEYARLSQACNGSYWDVDGGDEVGRREMWRGRRAGGVVRSGLSSAASSSAAAAASALAPAAKAECAKLLDRSSRVLDGINIYDVLDLCHASHRPSGPSSTEPPEDNHNPPCTSATLAEDWLNDWRVRAALHAAPIEQIGSWQLCSDRLHYTRDAGSMLPVHAELLPGLPGWPKMLREAGLTEEARAAEERREKWVEEQQQQLREEGAPDSKRSPPPPPPLRALIYSGDHDAAVPSTGSEAWTRAMGGGKPSAKGYGWRRWMVEGGTDAGGRPAEGEDAGEGEEGGGGGGGDGGAPAQVAGFVVDYEGGLTYATVRGAGHMVPTSKPLEALEMLKRFVNGETLAPPEKQEGREAEEEVVVVEEEAEAAAMAPAAVATV
jgi:serine carboxypeptidase-like clade I